MTSQQQQHHLQHGEEQPVIISDLCFHLSKSSIAKSAVVGSGAGIAGEANGHIAVGSSGGNQPRERERPSSSIPLPVAAIRVLLNVIRRSNAETMMGLQAELRDASDVMVNFAKLGGPQPLPPNDADSTAGSTATNNNTATRHVLAGRSCIALSSGCELFLKYVTRASLDTPNFRECKSQVLERGTRFAELALMARSRIAQIGCSFIRDGSVILTHGRSSVVESLLVRAALVEKKRFNVYVLEGRPDAGGIKSAKTYADAGIPTTVVLDSAMGYIMERVDMVLVGAEGVVENGGIVNKIGTYAMGVLAKEMGVPFYAAVESYKFTRLYPLNNADLPDMGGGHGQSGGGVGIGSSLTFLDTLAWSANSSASPASGGEVEKMKDVENETTTTTTTERITDSANLYPFIVNLPPSVNIENPTVDFTPAKFIALLFTDLGVLTPSAVSDELIRLHC